MGIDIYMYSVYAYINKHTYTHTCAHTDTRAHTHAHTHTYMCECIDKSCVYQQNMSTLISLKIEDNLTLRIPCFWIAI